MVGIIVEKQPPRSRMREIPDGLSIRLLGEIRVQRAGVNLTLPASKRTRALLGFLAATATPQSRQTLCELLWDGPDDPRAALRWSLTKLRPLVNEPGIERLKANREHISFVAHDTWIDIQRLALMCNGNLQARGLAEIEAAAGLLQGEFLDGLDLPSCFRFHHWCLAERERWGAMRRRMLTLLLNRLDSDPERALPHARAWVAADPLAETSHAKLVAVLASLGRCREAQDHYLYARALLEREMGAPLSGDLRPPSSPPPRRRLEPSLQGAAIMPAPIDNPVVAPVPRLIGRLNECEAILASLETLCSAASPGAMLFTGEPGIGKSRLLDYAAEQAGLRGVRVVGTRCFEAEAVRPYGCWADALTSILEEAVDPATRRDLALFLPSAEVPVNDEGSRTRLFAAVSKWLSAIAAQRPLLLIIDDLQWIDEGSSSLLHYVLRDSRRTPQFWFVGSARTDEIDDNPWCRRVVSALAQDGSVRRVKLSPMGAAEAAQFFNADTPAENISLALKESGGNPLYLIELANADPQTPKRDLEALITDRIARLAHFERELIVFASATTRDFQAELLGAAMALPEVQLMEAINGLERRGLLKASGDGRFDFAHDLIRQTTYRGLSQPRRRLLHRQIARALAEAAGNDHTLAGELAYHAGAGGDHVTAVEASITAGEHCIRLFANAAAMDAADRGLGHLAHVSAGPRRAHFHIALLKVKVFASARPSIRVKSKLFHELQQAAEAAELMGLPDDAALGWHMISWWTQRSNDALAAQRAILRAEEMSRPADEYTRCQQLANSGRCLLEVEGDVVRARAFLHEADRLAASLNQNFVELDWGRGLIARWDGDLVEARNSMRRALTLARLREDRWREIECLIWMTKIAIEGDRIEEISPHCDDIDAVARRVGDGKSPVADALRALALMRKKGLAEPRLQATLAALRVHDDKAQLAYILNGIAACHCHCGHLKNAHAAAAEALNAARLVQRKTEIVVAISLVAIIQAQAGSLEKARRTFGLLPGAAGDTALLSARARIFLIRAQDNLQIPTPVQTAPL
jgi:DNA-binding SARP family transcriptional activator